MFEKKPQESIDVFVEKLLIQPTTGAMKLHTHVVKCAENLLRLLLTFNANTNVLNFVIPDPVLPVQPVFYSKFFFTYYCFKVFFFLLILTTWLIQEFWLWAALEFLEVILLEIR